MIRSMKYILVLLPIMLFSQDEIEPTTMFWITNDAYGAKVIRWGYVFGDEFNGNELDTNKWLNSYPWGRSLYANKEQQYYTDGDNLEVSEGTLKITTKFEPGYRTTVPYLEDDELLDDNKPNKRYYPYTSGMIYSKRTFRHGFFEIVCKLPKGKGLWSAFWLYGIDQPDGSNEEIDVFEAKGEKTNEFHINNHCPDRSWPNVDCRKTNKWIGVNGDLTKAFQRYGVEWAPVYMIWVFNNQEASIWQGGDDFKYKESIIANTAVASDSGPFSPGPDGPTEGVFEIDYIRAWARLDNCHHSPQNTQLCNFVQNVNDHSSVNGKTVVFGGDDCEAILKTNSELDILATETIEFNDGFIAEKGAYFNTHIYDCPDGLPKNRSIDNNAFENFIMKKHSNEKLECNVSENQLFDQSSLSNNSLVDENKKILSLTLFPNPSLGILNIELLSESVSRIPFSIMNGNGKSVISGIIKQGKINSIDISTLPSGEYLFVSQYNSLVMSEKFIKK